MNVSKRSGGGSGRGGHGTRPGTRVPHQSTKATIPRYSRDISEFVEGGSAEEVQCGLWKLAKSPA